MQPNATPRRPLTQQDVDKEWPYQVLVPAHECTGHKFREKMKFCEGLSLCSRIGASMVMSTAYRIFCFKERRHAMLFRAEYDAIFRLPCSKEPGFTMIPVIGYVT